jgi:hypothetical protein
MRDDDLLLPCAGKIADDGLRRRCGWLEGQIVQVHPRSLESTESKVNATVEKPKTRIFSRDLNDNVSKKYIRVMLNYSTVLYSIIRETVQMT